MPLRIAAKIPRGETRYFKESSSPCWMDQKFSLSVEVNDRQKE
jgi:hypothetical protein